MKQSFEKMYNELKRQYDYLLEKNQNDLIKIRLREKALNETVAHLQKENKELKLKYQKEIQALNTQIQLLKKGNHQDSKISNSNNTKTAAFISNLEAEIKRKEKLVEAFKCAEQSHREGMQQRQERIKNRDEKLRQFQERIRQLAEQKHKLLEERLQNQNKIKSQQQQLQNSLLKQQKIKQQYQKKLVQHIEEWKAEKTKEEEEKIRVSSASCADKEKANEEAKKRQQILRSLKEQYQKIQEKYKMSGRALQMKESVIARLQSQNKQLRQKNEQKNEVVKPIKCGKCQESVNEIQLLKQMVKSLRTMLKAKQFEIDKLTSK